jgi:hypothetical protein
MMCHTRKTSIALLLSSVLLGVHTVVSFHHHNSMTVISKSRGLISYISSPKPTSDNKWTSLHFSNYDKDDGMVEEGLTSDDESEETSEKKEMIAQVMVVAVGAFLTYSMVTVILDTTAYLTNSVSPALDLGDAASFAGSVVGTVASASWEGLNVAIPFVAKGLMSASTAAAPIVQEASQKITEAATPFVQESAHKISEATSPMVEQAAQAVNEAASPYVSAFGSTISGATDMVKSTLDTKILAPIKDATDSVAMAVDSTIKDAAASVTSSIQMAADEATTSIKGTIPF